ncbi:phage portal protein [Streptococcus sciuri]|uniref:Phage portal protein n=1 Tax=Streptococcus sciuri TaxID=2973939 RepID=A0ABT2F7J7_9STRE|nr:phage portal protein [Streptococcus sciuri]MCS4488384.1 phage portal protein [Streptococcus sciuri]
MPFFRFTNSANKEPPQGEEEAYGLSSFDLEQLFSAGDWVSAYEALKNSDLFAIVNQLSNDLANVTLTVEKARLQGIVNNPSNSVSRHSFYQSIFAQLLLGGEAFVYRWRNANGSDVKWEFLKPSQVTQYPYEYEEGLYYSISFLDPKIAPKSHVPQNDILHFKLLSIDGGRSGVSPLMALVNEREIQKASHRLTLDALKNSLNANGVLKIKNGGLLSMKEKLARSRAVQRQMTGGPLVLDDLEEFSPLEIKSNISQLLNQANWTTTQFAKVYGIPDSYLGGQGDQQSSLDQIKGLYAHAINRYMQPLVSELSFKLGTAIDANIYPAIDPVGDGYAQTIANLVSRGTLAHNQGVFLLKRAGFLPEDLPEADGTILQVNSPKDTMKGGEENGDN